MAIGATRARITRIEKHSPGACRAPLRSASGAIAEHRNAHAGRSSFRIAFQARPLGIGQQAHIGITQFRTVLMRVNLL
ncbi:hypothetical protein [Pseudoxanthomonas sp.]|uniref:hypothetical protein n=1 Tax=Pseudoxanthomonas sp. TaxID=1871049 RepID=UPI00261E19F4|nr:hypothetical protein [Pseudoxanthomonas sp.]WDS34967.1 MAG: hypothetical protein O8I58_11320 [Pseudoxanthomonas sp.]